MMKRNMSTVIIFASVCLCSCSKPNVVGKWQCDKMVGAPAGSTMSGTFNFSESAIDAKIFFKAETISFTIDGKFDYSISGKYLTMQCTKVAIDPKSLDKQFQGARGEMEKMLQIELVGKKTSNEINFMGDSFTLTEPAGTMTYKRVK
jgi:hypothetical protein